MSPEVMSRCERDELFGRHVVAHIPALLSAARGHTGQLADAEDLVQDTLVRAYRGMHGFDGAHPRAWLMTILRNVAANRYRRRQPALLDDPEALAESVDGLVPGENSTESVVLDASVAHAVHRALDDLTTRQRDAILLVDLEELSYAEAAAWLHVPEGTVMSRLHAARARLRRALGRAGVVPSRGDIS
jgi:RNA polymerase sigma-70 factor (ECF subfamily)